MFINATMANQNIEDNQDTIFPLIIIIVNQTSIEVTNNMAKKLHQY